MFSDLLDKLEKRINKYYEFYEEGDHDYDYEDMLFEKIDDTDKQLLLNMKLCGDNIPNKDAYITKLQKLENILQESEPDYELNSLQFLLDKPESNILYEINEHIKLFQINEALEKCMKIDDVDELMYIVNIMMINNYKKETLNMVKNILLNNQTIPKDKIIVFLLNNVDSLEIMHEIGLTCLRFDMCIENYEKIIKYCDNDYRQKLLNMVKNQNVTEFFRFIPILLYEKQYETLQDTIISIDDCNFGYKSLMNVCKILFDNKLIDKCLEKMVLFSEYPLKKGDSQSYDKSIEWMKLIKKSYDSDKWNNYTQYMFKTYKRKSKFIGLLKSNNFI